MHSPTRLIVAFLLVVAVLAAWPAVADLAVSYTLKPVTLNDMVSVSFVRGRGAGDIIATGVFNVKDATGTVREQGQVEINLTGQAKTDLITWLNARVVPAYNAQRGL